MENTVAWRRVRQAERSGRIAGAIVVALLIASCSAAQRNHPFESAEAVPAVTPIITSSVQGDPGATRPPMPTAAPALSTPSPSDTTPAALDPQVTEEPTAVAEAPFEDRYQSAGTTCHVEPAQNAVPSGAVEAISFVVPTDMLAFECRVLTFASEPFNVQCDCIYPLQVLVSDRGHLAGQLDDLTAQLRNEDGFAAPITLVDRNMSNVDGTTTWVFDLKIGEDPAAMDRPHQERQVMLDAAGLTIVARDQTDDGPFDYETTLNSLEELLASVEISRPNTFGLPLQRFDGGERCVDDTWSVIVPDGWFTFGCLGGFNTSTESNFAMQCSCHGPLVLSTTSASLDQAASLTDITSDEQRTGTSNLEGRSIRTVEGQEATLGDARQVIIDLGSERLLVTGHRKYVHAAPGHTWEDTIVAMESLVDSLTTHDADVCHGDTGPRRVRSKVPSLQTGLVDPAGVSSRLLLEAGTPVSLTGCVERTGATSDDPGTLWLAVETQDGAQTGWLPATTVIKPEMAPE